MGETKWGQVQDTKENLKNEQQVVHKRKQKKIKTTKKFNLGQEEGYLHPRGQREGNWKHTWSGRGKGVFKKARKIGMFSIPNSFDNFGAF